MDRAERLRSRAALEAAVKGGMSALQSELWTALPGIVESFDASKCTVAVNSATQIQVRQPNGTWLDTNITLIPDCPVLFPGGGGWFSTFPIAKGDEGLIVFSARCIDAWWQQGGVQPQAELRMHDLSDGFFVPTGGMSNPNVPQGGVNASGPELRSKDGKNLIHLDSNAGFISMNNGATVIRADQQNNYAELSADSGAVSIKANGTDDKAEIVAPAGLWVNGVMVNVP